MSSRAERNLLIESNLPLVGYLASETHAEQPISPATSSRPSERSRS